MAAEVVFWLSNFFHKIGWNLFYRSYYAKYSIK